MADPTPYNPVYSFTGFQVNAPSTPLPAPALDNELLDIATSIATTVSAIKSVRRTDGALNNGLVTFDSLTLALQLMFTSTNPTNANLVAGAVAAAQAAATSAGSSSASATTSAASALANAIAAAASAASVNLTLFLAKANNLAGLGSVVTSRANLGLGSVATFDVGGGAANIVQLDGGAKIPAYDGSQLTGIDVLPVGATIFVSATTAPAGTVKVNGALLSRASFPRLWTFAQASANLVSEATWASASNGAFSTGDLATTFRIPDARGEFIRAFDSGRGVDARGINSWQADSLKDHTHPFTTPPVISGVTAIVGGGGSFPATAFSGNTGSPSTGAAAETRPRNIAMLACIKY